LGRARAVLDDLGSFRAARTERSGAEARGWRGGRRGTERSEAVWKAAKFVIAIDGLLHGLDVHAEVDGKIYLTEGCGQCTDELVKWFPEVEPYLKFHLNDMQPGCEHQRQALRGWEVGEVCGECGYAYGSKWLHAELPESVIAWAENCNG